MRRYCTCYSPLHLLIQTSSQFPGSMAFNWFFPQDVVDHKTPSRVNGIPLAMELRYRKEGAKIVINAANNLNLYPPIHCDNIGQSTVASCVYFKQTMLIRITTGELL